MWLCVMKFSSSCVSTLFSLVLWVWPGLDAKTPAAIRSRREIFIYICMYVSSYVSPSDHE